ncbi:MAG: ABC transporter ATP-binding protein [Thermoguttaceae bacterium]
MAPVIRFQEISKRFGAEVALDRFSLEVPGGSVFALLGENGAGKTTAIRILLGLAEPDSGQSEVLGMDSADQGLEIRRRVGYVPERLTLYEWMTVDEIGWFTAGFYGGQFMPEYCRLVEQFGLPARRKIKSLSKGMRAKVGLSLAMAHDPEVLVLDEPTSGLDALVRREFLESMVDRAATGKTVFHSSHQIAEVERVADIVAILHQGRLLLVEQLDVLKAQVREVSFTMSNGAVAPPDLPGEVLFLRQRARQWQVLLRTQAEDFVAALSANRCVENVEVRAPSLEEIFVAYMQQGREAGAEHPAKEEAKP